MGFLLLSLVLGPGAFLVMGLVFGDGHWCLVVAGLVAAGFVAAGSGVGAWVWDQAYSPIPKTFSSFR